MSFVIVEVAECATMVENDGVIWYHVIRPHFKHRVKNKEGSTPGMVCCPSLVYME